MASFHGDAIWDVSLMSCHWGQTEASTRSLGTDVFALFNCLFKKKKVHQHWFSFFSFSHHSHTHVCPYEALTLLAQHQWPISTQKGSIYSCSESFGVISFFVRLTQDVDPCRRPWSCRCHYLYYNNYVTHSGAGNGAGAACLWPASEIWQVFAEACRIFDFAVTIRLPGFFKTASKYGVHAGAGNEMQYKNRAWILKIARFKVSVEELGDFSKVWYVSKNTWCDWGKKKDPKKTCNLKFRTLFFFSSNEQFETFHLCKWWMQSSKARPMGEARHFETDFPRLRSPISPLEAARSHTLHLQRSWSGCICGLLLLPGASGWSDCSSLLWDPGRLTQLSLTALAAVSRPESDFQKRRSPRTLARARWHVGTCSFASENIV